jgi:hypothetical protein
MSYIENPKTKGSGIVCAVPQTGGCPYKCPDCWAYNGRSYLEPLAENLPNMPSLAQAKNRVVRVNDMNDSHHQQGHVIKSTKEYPHRFYNTSCPADLDKYDGPVVLTLNPGAMTDNDFWKVGPDDRKSLMMVRLRLNTWNLPIVAQAIAYYTPELPVIATFMAFHEQTSIPEPHQTNYEYRKRTTNSYWAITTPAWRRIMRRFEDNPLVYSCGEGGRTACKRCGNCLREYFAWREK